MAGDETAIVLCMDVLRWLGLSFTRVRRSPRGGLVAEDSKSHLFANVLVVGLFSYAFLHVDLGGFDEAARFYKSSTIVYPLFTKVMSFTIVAFLVCGNVYNRKFVRIIDLFVRVQRELERDFGRFGRRKGRSGRRTLFGFLIYVVATTALNLCADANLQVHYEKSFRILHYFCFYYVTLFTAHFVVTLNYLEEKFGDVNAAFRKIVPPEGDRPSASPAARRRTRRRLRAWTAAALDLREAEALANEVFGKQVCLTLLLAFSSVIINAYYLISLNLHGTSYPWLNVAMCLGFLQAVTVALLSTAAAESAANRANEINEIVFDFPVHLDGWRMNSQMKYFALFCHGHPLEFKAWIFYSVDYDSLLKVVLTSSAITAIILQCDIIKGSFDAS